MAKGEADGDVALHRHAGQVQRSVFSGEESKQGEDATNGDFQSVDGVAEDEQEDSQRQLDHVVDHQVNKKDVARICVEDLQGGKKSITSEVRASNLNRDECSKS